MDRLTQLQDRVDLLSYHCHRAVDQLPAYIKVDGVYPNMPPAVPGVPVQQPPQLGADCEEADVVFAREIVNTMREIDTIVDTLPSLEDNYDQQMRDLERLEEVNEQSGKNLSEAIDRGELYLSLIRAALDDIGDMALKAEPQEIESEEPEN